MPSGGGSLRPRNDPGDRGDPKSRLGSDGPDWLPTGDRRFKDELAGLDLEVLQELPGSLQTLEVR